MTRPSYTLLVNSCDGFRDCWDPFFTLLDRYWPDLTSPILLNTERLDYERADPRLTSTRVQLDHAERLSWSECLGAALDQVTTPLVLYMQEDYFIERPVDDDAVEAMAQRMIDHPDIAHIGLTHFGASGPFAPGPAPGIVTIAPRARYRVSTQAGLWRVEALRSYLLSWENGWMFELFGTARSWKRDELFLTIDPATTAPIIAYQHTGIVKGQWSDFVPALFEAEGLSVDYSRRGFHHSTAPGWLRKARLLKIILRRPLLAARSLIAG